MAVVAVYPSKWEPAYVFLSDHTGKPIADVYTHPGKLEFVRIAQTRPPPKDFPFWRVPEGGPRTTIYVAGLGFDTTESSSALGLEFPLVVSRIVPPGGEVVRSFYGLALFQKWSDKILPGWQMLVHPKGAVIDGFDFAESERDNAVDYISFWHSYDFQYLIGPQLSRVSIKFLAEKPGAYPARHEICFELQGANWAHDLIGQQPKWCDTEEKPKKR